MTVIFERETLPYVTLTHEQREICVHMGLFVREDGALKEGESTHAVTLGFWIQSWEEESPPAAKQ